MLSSTTLEPQSDLNGQKDRKLTWPSMHVAGHSAAEIGFLGWAALVSALLLVGMLFGGSYWLYCLIAAAGTLGICRLLAYAWSDSVVTTRHSGPLEVVIGSSVPIQIEVHNDGWLPVIWLLVEDLLPREALIHTPPALQIKGSRIRVMALGPGRRRMLSYRLTCNRRGYFQIGPTLLETGDPLGLFRKFQIGAEPQYLLVTPKTVPLLEYQVGSRRPVGEIKIRERVMDDPTRLQGIRAWLPGDPLRQVHWAATARTGTLHSKIYEQSTIAGVTLVLDLHQETNPSFHEPVRSDLAVTFAASIAENMYQWNYPFGLISNGRDAADRIRIEGSDTDYRTRKLAKQQSEMRPDDDRLRPVALPADRGPLQLRQVQHQLARLERTDGLWLHELLIETESRLARDTTLVVVLQHCLDSSAATIIGLARRGWAILVVANVFDPNDFALVAGPFIAAGISVVQLQDEAVIPSICQQITLR